MRRKNWYTKKYKNWRGKDMLKACLTIGGLGTLLCSIPIIGIYIKELVD